MFKKVFDFFIFTSLFIACCALLMVYQTSLLFSVPLAPALYGFVFFGSVCSYNFHWYLTPPTVPAASYKLRWNIANQQLHLVLFVVGLAGASITSLLLIKHWHWLVLTAFLTFLYSAPKIPHPLFIWLRKIAVGKTIFLAAAWTHITTLLPLLIELKAVQAQHIWFAVNRFFFLYAICIVFDRRDVEKDRADGIKSMITFLSNKGVDHLFWITSLLVLATALLLSSWFSHTTLLLLCLPTALLMLLYKPSKQSHSDYLYYFILDGLMAVSAPLLILAKFAR